MKGVFSAPFRINNLSTARTLLYVTAAANTVVEVLSTVVTNEDNETNEQLVCCWQKVTSLGTPTAITITPGKTDGGSGSMLATVKANVTASEPTYGAIAQDAGIVDVTGLMGFSSIGGYIDVPIPESRLNITGGTTWGLRLLVAPAATIDVDIQVMLAEIGG